MPKRRSTVVASITGGRSGGGGGAASAGMGGSGPGGSGFAPYSATVQQYSATRRRIESMQVDIVEPEHAHVHSASGHIYDVHYGENPSCDCPDFRVRHRGEEGYRCRHILGARSAAGMAVSDADVAAAQARVPLTNRAAFDAAQAAQEMAAQRAEESSAPAMPLGEHEVSLEDEEAFRALLERAQRGDFPYEYENVLGGSDNTFGVEIEFVGGNRQAIARELYERGLIPEARQTGYHSTRVPGMWSFENDGSVDGEVVSPVFRDTPEAWRQIEEVCEIIRRHGGRVDARCGGHVHIGRVPLDHDNVRFQNLVNLCRSNEDLIYRIASGGESGGQHRGTHYARPLARDVNISTHYTAVNSGHSQTIEFRYFNGTLDPKQIQTNVRLAHGLVRAAGQMRERQEASSLGNVPWGSVNRQRADVEEQSHSAVRRFLDRIFTRVNDKLSVLWLYATSRWQNA